MFENLKIGSIIELDNGSKGRVIIDSKTLYKNISKVADRIAKDYEERNPILICVDYGAREFFEKLCNDLKLLNFKFEKDSLQISRYSSNGKGGKINLISKPKLNLKGRDVIVIEDLIDKGDSIRYIEELLSTMNPNSLEYAIALEKENQSTKDFRVKYKVIDQRIDPDDWLVGFGMDDNGSYRNLQFIFVKEKVEKKESLNHFQR